MPEWVLKDFKKMFQSNLRTSLYENLKTALSKISFQIWVQFCAFFKMEKSGIEK